MAVEDRATRIARKRYDRNAAVYDLMELAVESSRFKAWRKLLWSKVEGERILEVGVGTGKNFVSTRCSGSCAIHVHEGHYPMLQRVCKSAGIDRRRFHALRHSSVLDALDAGISVDKVQKQLGHTKLQTTLNYLWGRNEDRARAYQECSLSNNLI